MSAALRQSNQVVDGRSVTLGVPALGGSLLVVGTWGRDNNAITGWSSPSSIIMAAAGSISVNGRPMAMGYKFAAGGEQTFTPICASSDGKLGTWAVEFTGLALALGSQVSAAPSSGERHYWDPGALTLAGDGLLVTWACSECDPGTIAAGQAGTTVDVSGSNPDSTRPSWAGAYRIVSGGGSGIHCFAQHLSDNVDAYGAIGFAFDATTPPVIRTMGVVLA